MYTLIKRKWLISALFAIAGILFKNSAQGQIIVPDTLKVNVGVETGIVTGFQTPYTNKELGLTIQWQYGLSSSLAITFTSGYYIFFGELYGAYLGAPGAYSASANTLHIIPFKLGVKKFINHHLYVSSEAGFGFGGAVYNLVAYSAIKQNQYIFSSGFGYALKNLDLVLRYEFFWGASSESFMDNGPPFINSSGILALRVAYRL
jgi:hypothetical protein